MFDSCLSAILSCLVCYVFVCFCAFPYGVLGQVWYLIVAISDLCRLPYFDKVFYKTYNNKGCFFQNRHLIKMFIGGVSQVLNK